MGQTVHSRYRQAILSLAIYKICNIEGKSEVTALMMSQLTLIQIDIANLIHGAKME
jgi:hypothetical protein